MAGRFKGVRTVGKGAHGFVQLAIDHAHDDQAVAIKYIPRGETAAFYKYVLREVLHHQQLSLCKHPHIVEFHEVFLTPRYLGIVMEYIDGQDLQAYLVKQGGSLPEDVARFVFQQLVIAVDFIHRKGKVNRDIKLANVLVVDSAALPLVKLCDFGFSKDKFDDSAPQTQIGTALFTAPEVFLNVAGHVYEGEAVDVWSCGVVLHMLLFGCHPFLTPADMMLGKSEQMVKLIENTVKGQLQIPAVALGSPVSDLLHRILVPAPRQRYTIKDICMHPWFMTKLPPGALDLNNSYLPTSSHQVARQTPEAIKLVIRNAVQVAGPDGTLLPPIQPPAASGDWADSPSISAQGMEEHATEAAVQKVAGSSGRVALPSEGLTPASSIQYSSEQHQQQQLKAASSFERQQQQQQLQAMNSFERQQQQQQQLQAMNSFERQQQQQQQQQQLQAMNSFERQQQQQQQQLQDQIPISSQQLPTTQQPAQHQVPYQRLMSYSVVTTTTQSNGPLQYNQQQFQSQNPLAPQVMKQQQQQQQHSTQQRLVAPSVQQQYRQHQGPTVLQQQQQYQQRMLNEFQQGYPGDATLQQQQAPVWDIGGMQDQRNMDSDMRRTMQLPIQQGGVMGGELSASSSFTPMASANVNSQSSGNTAVVQPTAMAMAPGCTASEVMGVPGGGPRVLTGGPPSGAGFMGLMTGSDGGMSHSQHFMPVHNNAHPAAAGSIMSSRQYLTSQHMESGGWLRDLDPDPQAEPLMDAGMDISGNVMFDSDLLKMIQFE